LEQITILIRIDAFRFTLKNKRTLMWEAHLKISKETAKVKFTPDFFSVEKVEFTIPPLSSSWEEDAFDQMELLGFPLFSPFSISTADETEAILAKDLLQHKNEIVWVKGYLIHSKNTTTSKQQNMFFGTFLDSEGEWLDTVHFPDIAQKYPFRGKGVYKIKGKVVSDYDCVTIEAEYMEKLGVIQDPRYVSVRAGELPDTSRTSATGNSRASTTSAGEARRKISTASGGGGETGLKETLGLPKGKSYR
jgi:DNA polymerase III alpha subunit